MPIKQIKRHGVFWAAWLKSPRQVGALIPSGKSLARAMAAQVNAGEGFVVEIGAGTGSVTQALIDAGIGYEQLFVIERDALLHTKLKNHFPKLRAVQGDAKQLHLLLKEHGIAPVKAIVSSLPLLSMPQATEQAVLRQAAESLEKGGRLIQFTYGLHSPISPRETVSLDLLGHRMAWIWQNIPPAAVWVYQKH